MARSMMVEVVFLISLLVLGRQQAWAETIMFSFTGTVTSVDPTTIGAIGGTDVVDVGDTIAGSFTYDLDTPGTIGGTGPRGIVIRTDYPSAVPPGKLTYSVGSLSVTTEPGTEFFVVIVGNGTNSELTDVGEVDKFIVGAGSSAPIALESVFRLEDTTQSVFSDMELPTKLRKKDFDRRQFEVYSIGAGGANLMFVTTIDKIAAVDIRASNSEVLAQSKDAGMDGP
jgi:hypothetical protein